MAVKTNLIFSGSLTISNFKNFKSPLISLLPSLPRPPLRSSARVRVFVFLTSMANQVLQLVIDKGPRWGETLDCQPGSAPIRIGRIVRGNTVAIMDLGISQKHLLLQFLSSSPRWALTDLNTSEAEKGRPRRAEASSRKGEASKPMAEKKSGRGRRAGTRVNRAAALVKKEIPETIAEDGGEIPTKEEDRVGIPEEAGVSQPGEERNLGRRRGRGRERGRGRRVGA